MSSLIDLTRTGQFRRFGETYTFRVIHGEGSRRAIVVTNSKGELEHDTKMCVCYADAVSRVVTDWLSKLCGDCGVCEHCKAKKAEVRAALESTAELPTIPVYAGPAYHDQIPF
jgi:hypothetical protein